jgi:hypothetical protein
VTGTYPVLLYATNAAGTSAPRALSIEIGSSPSAPVVNSPTAITAQAGAAFTYQITTVSGNATSYDALLGPAWVTINNATGALSGVPSLLETGPYAVTLSATNASGTSAPVTLAINVLAATNAPVISSSQGAAGTAGAAFSYQIIASGSPTAYSAEGLPPGLAVSATGLLSGTPSASGTFLIKLFARNASGRSYPFTLTLTLAPSAPFAGN